MNSALLMKGLWKVFNHATLPWVQLLLEKHYKHRPARLTHAKPAGCSPIWRSMLATAAPFFTLVNFSLGNGKVATMWNSRWSGDLPLCKLFPNLYALSPQKQITVKTWFRRHANRNMLGFRLPLNLMEQEEIHRLEAIVCSTSLLSDTEDSVTWRWESSGRFSARSAYDFLTFSGVVANKLPQLWKIKAPLRIKIFIWLAARNRILTAEILARRGWQGPSICVLYHNNEENLEHLLF